MSDTAETLDMRYFVESRFAQASIPVSNIDVRRYPEEVIFVIQVPEMHVASAATLGNKIDEELSQRGVKGFVTVRKAEVPPAGRAEGSMKLGVGDPRVDNLLALIASRARSSESQPSLHYVVDAAANISRVRAPRHHLVFGRRGAGKTALLLEGKRTLDADGHVSVWVNIQTYRRESAERIYLWLAQKICSAFLVYFRDASPAPKVSEQCAALLSQIDVALGVKTLLTSDVDRIVPRVQGVIDRFTKTTGRRVYIFLDDFHYVTRNDQPRVLDMLHGCLRDCDAWLKVAAIKHLSKWFQSDPPTGLQMGHDADGIDLDITLQDPSKAKGFLERVLRSYATHVGIPTLSAVFSGGALDRLVLASGTVPRDYLVLCSSSITHAKDRPKGRVVGKQDVATAAGAAAKVKLTELEEDAASDEGSAGKLMSALQIVRSFCLDKKRGYTYFRIDFRDKESRADEYAAIQSLMDLRLLHLINPSLSDGHHAGVRSEVYMLDLSQFSGERMKKNLRALDFSSGHLALYETGTTKEPRKADTANKLLSILRLGPVFPLEKLATAGTQT